MNNLLPQTVPKFLFYILTKLLTTRLTQFCVISDQLSLYYSHQPNFLVEFRPLKARKLCQSYHFPTTFGNFT